jgi:hypothetical protein
MLSIIVIFGQEVATFHSPEVSAMLQSDRFKGGNDLPNFFPTVTDGHGL